MLKQQSATLYEAYREHTEGKLVIRSNFRNSVWYQGALLWCVQESSGHLWDTSCLDERIFTQTEHNLSVKNNLGASYGLILI